MSALDSPPLAPAAAVPTADTGDHRPAAAEPLAVVLAAWAPFHAGAEVAAERLAVGLAGDGHRVTVVLGTDGETAERMRQSQVDVRCLPLAMTDKLKWWRYRRAQRELRRLLVELQPDVTHANDLPTSQMIAQAAYQMGIPRLCHHRWIFGGGAIDWLNKFGAERHVFVSRALMQELCDASPRLPVGSCEVVYDGLPLPSCPNDSNRRLARKALELSADKPVVLFAGQIIERKGVADLLHAWKHLSGTWADRAELVFVGDDLEGAGAYRRQMEALAAELECRVRFVGFQKNVPQWLAAADVCVVPSHAEPLGNATLEAMAHARPVIGTNVGGIPEMVVNGVTGLLVPPHDPPELAGAIDRLLRDAVLRDRLGAAARQRCEERFSIRVHVEAVVAQYRMLLVRRATTIA